MEEKKEIKEFCAIPKEIAQKMLQEHVNKYKDIFDTYNVLVTTVNSPVTMKPSDESTKPVEEAVE